MTEKPGRPDAPQSAESAIWMLRRSRTDVKLSGLCGGLAKHWGVDPVLVRVSFALLALSAGMGVILYLAGWLLLPVEGKDRAPVDDLFGEAARRWPKEVWIAIVTLLCVAGFAIFGSISPFSIGPAVVIAVIWYFGFYKPRQRRSSTNSADASYAAPPAGLPSAPASFSGYPGPPTPFTEAAEAWRRRIEEHARQSGQPNVPRTPADPAAWPAPPATNLRPDPAGSSAWTAPRTDFADPEPSEVLGADSRQAFLATPDPIGIYVEPPAGTVATASPKVRPSARRLRLITLILVGLVMSGLGVADYLGASVPLTAYFAGGLLVVGIGLLIATWFGRARGMLGLGVLLAVATLVCAAAPSAHLPNLDNQDRVYTSASAWPAGGDSLDVGNLTVNMAQLELTDDASYRASIDLGNLTVVVPPDTRVVVKYATDLGSVRVNGKELPDGAELSGSVADPEVAQPGEPTLTLDLSVDVGNLEVRR